MSSGTYKQVNIRYVFTVLNILQLSLLLQTLKATYKFQAKSKVTWYKNKTNLTLKKLKD